MTFSLLRLSPMVLLCFSLSANAMTLQDALQTALQNSPDVQNAKSVSEEISWKRVEAASTFYPKLTGTVDYLTNHEYMFVDYTFPGLGAVSIPNLYPTTLYSLNAQYLLFDGFASTDRYRASSLNESAAAKQLDWMKFQTQRQVALQFYRALASQILKDVAEQNLKSLQDHLRDTSLFKKAGLSTNYDVLRVEVQVSEAQTEVMDATDSIEISKGKLAETLGLEQAPEVTGTLPVVPASLADKLNDSQIPGRLDIAAQRERTDAMKELETADSRHWVPKISAYGVYQSYNNRNDRFDDWDNFREAYEVGFNLTWEFFDGFKSTAKAHESVEEKFQAEKTLQIAQLKAKQDLLFWKKKFSYYSSVYQARLSDINKSKESVRLAKEGRRVGARTNTDLLDAETDLYRSQAGAVNAQIGAIEAIINLELATGQDLAQLD